MADPINLDPIKARLEAATAGEWKLDRPSAVYMDSTAAFVIRHDDRPGRISHLICATTDAELIAHAPSDMRALLAEVESLRAQVAQYEGGRVKHYKTSDGVWYSTSRLPPGARVVGWRWAWEGPEHQLKGSSKP